VELRDECRARQDEDRPHHERPHDAPEEHAVLQRGRHLEVREDDQEHEHVVDGERFLDQVTRRELERALRPEPVVDEHVEAERQADPEGAPRERLLVADRVGLAMEHPEVEHQQGQDEQGEPEPESRAADAVDRHEVAPPLSASRGGLSGEPPRDPRSRGSLAWAKAATRPDRERMLRDDGLASRLWGGRLLPTRTSLGGRPPARQLPETGSTSISTNEPSLRASLAVAAPKREPSCSR